ncbi:MAG: M23 family metallopeptidase [Alphaproteobacteria bacterium]|nr:MAG: M23 family metallopeptidase [Alphaproteobacteria bacterium]
MVRGQTEPGASVTLDGRSVFVDRWGRFVFGFGRDAAPTAELGVRFPDGDHTVRTLSVAPRRYRIERVDGLPPKMVTPPQEVLDRIKRENARIAEVRRRTTNAAWFWDGFIRPAEGRFSGFYGSQRILNGKPRRPHFGLDIAGPRGTPVVAPAPGIVALAVTDYYYTGGTVMIDHGHGVTSVLMHLDTVDIKEGQRVEAGDRVGTIGATGRATGPHLDWRVNWFDVRLDPGLLLDEARSLSAPIGP